MASSSGGDPGGSTNRGFPRLTEQFGAMTTLLLTGKKGRNLPEDPWLIGESVEEWAGPIERCDSEARGSKYILRTRNHAQVEKLLQFKELKDGTEVEVVLHPKLNICRCVISTHDLMSKKDEEIAAKLANQGVIDVRRITNSKKENTPAIILTFNRATYPDFVKVGLLRVPTRPYYPNPLLCFNCFVYGHPGRVCPNPKRCFNCSKEHAEMENCQAEAFCQNCLKNHRPSSRQCETYKLENAVIRTKIDFNLTYPEARKRVEAGNGSYAKAAAQPRLDQARFDALTMELKNKQNEIDQLKKEAEENKALREQVKQIIEQNKVKEEKIEELIHHLKQRDEKIEKIEAQNQTLRRCVDGLKSRTRTESQASDTQSETEGTKKKKKRHPPPTFPNQQTSAQGSSGMSPPSKKTAPKTSSPIRTRSTRSQIQDDVVELPDDVKMDTANLNLPNPSSYGSQPQN